MALPIALQLYTVRDNLAEDFAGTLKTVKAMGYDGVEFAGLYGNTPATIRDLLAEIGLVPVSAHVPYAELIADTENTLKAYKEIGCNYVAVPYMTEEYRPGAAKFEEAIENIRKIAEVAKKVGITLLYHNHDFEFAKVNGEYGLDVMYKEIPADLLETEIDTCWVNVAGEDPADYVRKYSGRAPVVHLKDFTGERSNNMYKLIGLNEEKKAEEAKKANIYNTAFATYTKSDDILLLTKAISDLEALTDSENARQLTQLIQQKIATITAEKQRAAYRSQKVCQHCGGKFKGLFSKKCSVCGKIKDY